MDNVFYTVSGLFNGDTGAYMVGCSDNCFTFTEAMRTVNRIKEREDSVAAWVDAYTGTADTGIKKFGTLYMECFVDVLGRRATRKNE